MRSLLCVTPLFPSVEKPYYCIYLLQQLQALEHYGYKVSVLVPSKSEIYSIKEEAYGGLRVIRVNYKKPNGEFRAFTDLDVEKNRYDLIALNLCGLDLYRFFMKYTIPVVVHFHGLNVWENNYEPYPLYAKIVKARRIRIIKKADALIGVSEKVKNIAGKYYPKDKIHIVYNGVNPDLFYPRRKSIKPSFDIYCVANLIKLKGHEYLIKAVASAREQLPEINIRLHIIGNGPLRDKLKELCKSLHLIDSVLFEGELPYEDIAMRLGSDCDMFIMPSYFESLGCVYLEAMACEVPSLGVYGCGIDEIITDSVNGFLVDPKNVGQITEKIVWAVNNPNELKKIGVEGRNTVQKRFTWEESGKSLADTYERIINKYEQV